VLRFNLESALVAVAAPEAHNFSGTARSRSTSLFGVAHMFDYIFEQGQVGGDEVSVIARAIVEAGC
jgi:hypothetical protein